jgi:hypothetical protein
MENNKELLEATVKGLQDKLELLQTELNVKTLQLNNVNKPKLNQSTMDIIYDCIDEGIEEYNFSDSDAYEFEPEFDYDSKVVIGSIELTHKEYVKEPIIKLIEKRFNIIDDTEDES